MTSTDVRDILDLKATEPRLSKKQKLVVRRPDNISKEVFSLIGERMPPVVLQPETEKYQKRFKVTRKAQPWEWQAFRNPCRQDGLVLHHWVKKVNVQPTVPEGPATPAEPKSDDAKSNVSRSAVSHWTQYNHKVAVPEYDDQLYEAQLQSNEWTREETDYLFELVKDFDLRWTLIADRYEFKPKSSAGQEDAMVVVIAPKSRSMEDLKARYYQVASKVIAIKHPPSGMSEQEYEAYECMTKFQPDREIQRKKIAGQLLNRSSEEITEENTLLKELKRITDNEEKFLHDRQELYDRLDHPVAQGSIAAYESSAGLNQLVQTLLHADKLKKRRSITAAGENTSNTAQGTPSQQTPNAGHNPRGSISGQSATKKGSNSAGNNSRQLSASDEAKYGVSTHDRLSSGVSFRSSRIDKLLLAKSASQSQKLQGIITQLGLPLRAHMPTTKVSDEYEQLIQNAHKLLDVRKHSEKTANEIRVLTTQKEAREKRANGEDDSSIVNGDNVEKQDGQDQVKDDSDADADADADAEEDAEEDADGEDDREVDQSHHSLHVKSDDEEDEEDEDNQEPSRRQGEGDDVEEDADGGNDSDAFDLADQPEGHEEEEDDGEAERSEKEESEAEDADPDDDRDELAEDPRASVAPSTRSARSAGLHKRSASVLSTPSEKSTKRMKR